MLFFISKQNTKFSATYGFVFDHANQNKGLPLNINFRHHWLHFWTLALTSSFERGFTTVLHYLLDVTGVKDVLGDGF